MSNRLVWLPITETDGRYEVSNDGQVRIVGSDISGRRRCVGRILKPSLRGKYLKVGLSLPDRRRVDRSVHVLVACAFIGPCPSGHEVNHKNGRKLDCAASNLEYLTSSANQEHAFRVLGRRVISGEYHALAKFSNSQVQGMRVRRAEGELIKTIAKDHCAQVSHIAAICSGRIWKHVGGPITRRRVAI